MVWSTDADDAKMLLDIPFPIDFVLIDQLALNLADICLDNTLQILLYRCYVLQKLERFTTQTSPKFGL